MESLELRRVEALDALGPVEAERALLRANARHAHANAVFLQEARVFGLRLAITLPLIVVALWALRTRRDSPLWPLWRGFVLFALFAFFVELVPYLPSYGGYVHYGVGVVVTLVLGAWLIRAARRHMALRRAAAERPEAERRQTIDHEEALRKVERNVCPSCERTLRTTDGARIGFCVHCGLRLFDDCGRCGTRNMVFYPYCLSCGGPIASGGPDGGDALARRDDGAAGRPHNTVADDA